jgi:hypothetical protein
MTSKLLGTKRLKLITKSSPKVISAMKLKCNLQILTLLESGRRQLRAKSVELVPNGRELIREVINYSVIPLKKLLLLNSNKISRLSSGLIMIMRKNPHLMSLIKLHNINIIMIVYTGYKNCTSVSILIKPRHVCVKPRLIRSQAVIVEVLYLGYPAHGVQMPNSARSDELLSPLHTVNPDT